MKRSRTSVPWPGPACVARQALRLPRAERVTDPRRVRALYRAFGTPRCAGLRVCFAPNGAALSRVVVCPGRGYRSAVARNRQRRLVREAYRLLKPRVAPGYDLLLQVGVRRRELGVVGAGAALGRLLHDAGLLRRG